MEGGPRRSASCTFLHKSQKDSIRRGERGEREKGKQRRMIRPPGQGIRHCQNCFVSRYWTSGARYEPAYHLPGHNSASPELTGLVSDLSAIHSFTSTQGSEQSSTLLHGRKPQISNDTLMFVLIISSFNENTGILDLWKELNILLSLQLNLKSLQSPSFLLWNSLVTLNDTLFLCNMLLANC